MAVRFTVLAIYFLVVLAIGIFARRRSAQGAEEYFLAGRGLGTFILLCTLAATNFSAFTVFGCSGAGYRDGLAFFPVMAFGTGFMALTFWLVGRKVWQLGKQHGLITPAELVHKLYSNRWLSLLFAAVMIIWTVPYLALQPLAGGMVLNGLFEIPAHLHYLGPLVITAVIVAYTLRGGFRAVVLTDAFQGLLMVGLMVAALVIVANQHGGFAAAIDQVMAQAPELFSRPGGQGRYLPGVWFSLILLWFFCDPMFPQLFQRFFSARSEKALGRSMLLYPLVCTVVFALPILLGMLGRLSFPGLGGREADKIVPMLMTTHAGDLMGTLILTAGIGALMSTMESQLLTLRSIFTRDVLPGFGLKPERLAWAGRGFVILLAIAGLIVAINPVATIIKIGFTAFTGLAALFPTVLFGIYLKRPHPAAALSSILAGQAILILHLLGVLTASGYLPALPVIIGSLLVYIVVQALSPYRFHLPRIDARALIVGLALAGVFLLAMDFWNWERNGPLFLSIPLWVWYSIGLSALQTVLMVFLVRRTASPEAGAPVAL